MSFFDSIYNFFALIVEFISGSVTGIVRLAQIISGTTTFVTMASTFVPSLIGSSVLLVISVGVIKLFLGWGNS